MDVPTTTCPQITTNLKEKTREFWMLSNNDSFRNNFIIAKCEIHGLGKPKISVIYLKSRKQKICSFADENKLHHFGVNFENSSRILLKLLKVKPREISIS